MKTPRMRLHLWLENEDGLLFGQGRMELLARIRDLGSLRKAAEALGMSYRAAWGKLKATDFPDFASEQGYRGPQDGFIDGLIYDGRHPNAYLQQFAIGLKGDERVQ